MINADNHQVNKINSNFDINRLVISCWAYENESHKQAVFPELEEQLKPLKNSINSSQINSGEDETQHLKKTSRFF